MYRQPKTLSKYLFLAGILALLMPVTACYGADEGNLQEFYSTIKPELENNIYSIPVYIESEAGDNAMQGDVYGVLEYPLAEIRQALADTANWCEIVPLHFNIKACTCRKLQDHCELTFYTGRKYYEPADEVYQLTYQFNVKVNTESAFHTLLIAPSGPLGTYDYQIQVRAIPISNSSTFIHFSYSYQYNLLTSIGTDAYLATLGRDKVGFTVTGHDETGKPVFIGGVQGIVERNAVRYYLAIVSYLETRHIDQDDRFSARLNKWFDLTEHHHRQLHEMDKQDYLKYKHQEHLDQLRLQQNIDKDLATEPQQTGDE